MKINYIFLLICCITAESIMQGMKGAQAKAEIQQKIRTALTAFEVPPQEGHIQIDTPYRLSDPKTMRHWSGGSMYICLSEQIQSNPYLTEFASLCIAAGVKNNHTQKSIFAFFAAEWGTLFLSTLPALWTTYELAKPSAVPIENGLVHGLITIAAVSASWIPAGVCATSKRFLRMLDDAICDHYDAQAFALACHRLIEQNNLKPLATYCAFAKLIEHRPLSQKTQLCIIESALKNQNFVIASAHTNYNSMRSDIFKEGRCVSSGTFSVQIPAMPEVNLAVFDTSAMLMKLRMDA